MLLEFSKSLLIKSLLTCLGVVTLIVSLANILGEDTAVFVGNLLYIPIQITLLVISLWAVRYFGIDGVHGIGWICFLGFVICWFAGDMTWIVQEMILHIEPYPSVSDIFYLSGYPFLLMFTISYIIPFRDAISKLMLIISVCLSIILVVLSVHVIGIPDIAFDTVLSIAYPVFDGIILVPVVLGLYLFFKSKTDMMWSLILFGILATFVGDLIFSYMESSDIYHTGNIMELAFFWSYILLIFGVYYHKKTMSVLRTNSL